MPSSSFTFLMAIFSGIPFTPSAACPPAPIPLPRKGTVK